MLPTEQRLDRDDLARRELDQRLVDEAKLVAFERPVKLVLGLKPAHCARVHLLVEQLDTGRVQLRSIHGLVGIANQGLGVLVRLARERDADARADEDLVTVGRERLGEGALNPPRDRDRLGLDGEVLAEHHELVTAEARHCVARPDHVAETPRRFPQQLVADAVPQAVVDDLEPVEVEKEHRDRSRTPLGAR